jgi:hypothetical protein
MTCLQKVLTGMFVFGCVTAADMTTTEAHPQVNPRVASFDTVLAKMLIGLSNLDLVNMVAL